MTVRNLNEVVWDIVSFCCDKEREYYLNWSGLKEEMDLSSIYEKYKHLFTEELIAEIKERERSAVSKNARKELGLVQAFLISDYLDMSVKELTDRAQTMESREVVKLDGEKIPFRQVPIKIANEQDRERRREIFKRQNKVIDKINVVLKERMGMLHEKSRDLGYKSYADLFSKIKNIDFHSLEDMMRSFISKTESVYTKKMADVLREKLRLDLENAEKHDLRFLFRAQQFDPYFKREEMLETLRRTLLNMGIDMRRQRNIHLDTEERLRKKPRAFVATLKVPEDVRLVIRPIGGHDDYATLFHEAGHAEHFGCTDPRLGREYKYLGDNSVTESFAFLLEYLLMNERWLRQHTRMKDSKEYLDFLVLYKLYFPRRYGAKLSYELKLHENGLKGMDRVYKETLERPLKFRHPRSHYLTDVDDGFYAAQYLRAWIFEAQLRIFLEERFGYDWFNDRRAGGFLRRMWSKGQKYDVVELAQKLGYEDLDIEPLTEQMIHHFSGKQ